MSEKKASEIILEAIQGMQKQLDELKKSSTTSTPEKHEHVAMPESARGHKTIDEVADCPTCKAKLIEKFKPEIIQAEKARIKSLKYPVRCDACGEVYDREEKQDCPTCHK